jgi:hypothetical protein
MANATDPLAEPQVIAVALGDPGFGWQRIAAELSAPVGSADAGLGVGRSL